MQRTLVLGRHFCASRTRSAAFYFVAGVRACISDIFGTHPRIICRPCMQWHTCMPATTAI